MAETLLDKKMDYSFDSKDFIIDGELTVTITLREYRELLKNDATRKEQIDKATTRAYEKEREANRLKEENTNLKSELYELKKSCEAVETKRCELSEHAVETETEDF